MEIQRNRSKLSNAYRKQLYFCIICNDWISVTSSTIKLTDTVVAIALNLIVFAAMYYVGMKTNWFGEIEN